jgi:hypothetical protein
MGAGEGEKFPGVGAGVRCHRPHLAFLEQVPLVVQRGDVTEVDAGDRQGAATIEGLERRQHQITHRGEQDRGVQGDGRPGRGALGRGGTEIERELLGGLAAGHDVHLGALGERHLCGDVCAAAEAVDPEPATGRQLGPEQRPIADDAGAQQRRQFGIGVSRGQPVDITGWCRDEFGVAAVGVPAGVARIRAEVLRAPEAESAAAAGVPEPGHPDPIADGDVRICVFADCHHLAHYLMAGDDARSVNRQVALVDVEVRATHAARPYGDQHFVGTGRRDLDGAEFERTAPDRRGLTHPPCAHGLSLRRRQPART